MITPLATKLGDALGTMLHSPMRRNLKKYTGIDRMNDSIRTEGHGALLIDWRARREHFTSTILSETLENIGPKKGDQ